MGTDKTVVVSCRISREKADKIRVLEEQTGIRLRDLVEEIADKGVNTFGSVNTEKWGKSVNTLAKSVNTKGEKSKNVGNNSVYTESESVNTEMGSLDEEIYKELMSMVKTYGMDYQGFIQEIIKLLKDGSVYGESGSLRTTDSDLDTIEYKTKCASLGVNAQTALNKFMKTIRG